MPDQLADIGVTISEDDITDWLSTADFEAKNVFKGETLSQWERWALLKKETLFGELEGTMQDALLRSLRGISNPEAIREALTLAHRQANQVATGMVKSELQKIGRVISNGIKEGLGPREVARNLKSVTGLDSQRASRLRKIDEYLDTLGLSPSEKRKKLEAARKKLLADRRSTIARTEQRFATSEGNNALAKARNQKFKVWMTVGDSRVSPEICATNEAIGYLPIDSLFPSGHNITPGHPNCRCTVVYKTRLDEEDEARAQQRADNTQAALDA